MANFGFLRQITQQMMEAFPNVPIVPNLGRSSIPTSILLSHKIGNNDIWPHNGASDILPQSPDAYSLDSNATWAK